MSACDATRGHLNPACHLRCTDIARHSLVTGGLDCLAAQLQEWRKPERGCDNDARGHPPGSYGYGHVNYGKQRMESARDWTRGIFCSPPLGPMLTDRTAKPLCGT
jgi:hypothetical protein